MTTTPDSNAFAVHRSEVRNGVTIAYVREGVGGIPILLLHGYPETKRIWWRNIAPLAAAGFEVIAPDFRGHGGSSLAPDDFYDIAAYSIDCYTLVHDVLGHQRCAVAGGDVGGVSRPRLRYPGFARKCCSTVPPPLDEVYVDSRPTTCARAAERLLRPSANDPRAVAELDTLSAVYARAKRPSPRDPQTLRRVRKPLHTIPQRRKAGANWRYRAAAGRCMELPRL